MKGMKFIFSLALIVMATASLSLRAAEITLQNATLYEYSPQDEYNYSNLAITEQKNSVTIGFILGPGESFDWTVAAPSGLDMYAAVTEKSLFSGEAILLPSPEYIVYGGTSHTFSVNYSMADEVGGEDLWLSVLVDPSVNNNSIWFSQNPGWVINPFNGFIDTGPGPSEVPLPGAAWLFISALIGLGVARVKNRKQPKLQVSWLNKNMTLFVAKWAGIGGEGCQ